MTSTLTENSSLCDSLEQVTDLAAAVSRRLEETRLPYTTSDVVAMTALVLEHDRRQLVTPPKGKTDREELVEAMRRATAEYFCK